MAKSIGNLSVVISANTGELRKALSQAAADIGMFKTSADSLYGFADDAKSKIQGVVDASKGFSSIGANFAAATPKIEGAAEATGGLASQLKQVHHLAGLVGKAFIVFEVAKRFGQAGLHIGHILFDNQTEKALEFANTLKGPVGEQIQALTSRIQELQSMANEGGGYSFFEEVKALTSGMTSAGAREQLKVLRADMDRLGRQADQEQSDREQAAEWEKYDQDMKAYTEYMKEKETLHRQIVDRINEADLAGEKDPFKKLLLQMNIDVAEIREQFSGKGMDEAMQQLIDKVVANYRQNKDELLKSMSSDISDMFEEQPLEQMQQKMHEGFATLIRSGSAAAQTLAGRTSQTQMAQQFNRQLDLQRQANKTLKSIDDHAAKLDSLHEVDM